MVDSPKADIEARLRPYEHRIIHPKPVRWNPQPDITAFELALCMNPLVGMAVGYEAALDALPAEARRHFEEVD